MPDPPALPGEATSGSGRFCDVVVLGDVDSTNRYVADAARSGAKEGLVVVADHQRAGRGRLGRQWVEPGSGALLCSVLLRPTDRDDAAALIGVVLGLAAVDAIWTTTGARAGLKWPNDVTLEDKKVAGILAERIGASTDAAIVAGIGMNLSFPKGWADELSGDDAAALVTSAATIEEVTGVLVERNAMRDALLQALESHYASFLGDGGPLRTVQAYRARCTTIGRSVRVETATERFEATATGVTDDGRLVLSSGGERLVVAAADVVHLR